MGCQLNWGKANEVKKYTLVSNSWGGGKRFCLGQQVHDAVCR